MCWGPRLSPVARRPVFGLAKFLTTMFRAILLGVRSVSRLQLDGSLVVRRCIRMKTVPGNGPEAAAWIRLR